MKIRITSDGMPFGTTLQDSETGKPLWAVRNVRWEHRAGDIPSAEIEVFLSPVELKVNGKIIGVCAAPVYCAAMSAALMLAEHVELCHANAGEPLPTELADAIRLVREVVSN